MYNYLAIVWDPENPETVKAASAVTASVLAKSKGWSVTYATNGIFVLQKPPSDGSGTTYCLGSQGVVLGHLFRRRDESYLARPAIAFDEREIDRIVDGGCECLIQDYWGSYVSIVYDKARRKHHVLREPIGNLPCYHTRYMGMDVFFANVADCVRLLPIRLSINSDYLARWLVFSRLVVPESGLAEIDQILGGERLTLHHDRRATRTLLWDPVRIARNPRFAAVEDAQRELRRTVQNAVDAWASCYRVVAHKLSGGLDSSIVAACLAHSPANPRIQYVNFSVDVGLGREQIHLRGYDKRTADKVRAIVGQGDERYFARLVAERWSTPLMERQRNSSMDLRRLWQAPMMTSPPMYFTCMETDDMEIELATTLGTQAFFSGQAGDSVFYVAMRPFPAIDHAYLHGLGPALWPRLMDAAKLSRESVWAVLAKTLRYGFLRRPYPPAPGLLSRPHLLCDDLTARLRPADLDSIWDRVEAPLPPGKQRHLSGLAGTAHYDYVFHSGGLVDHVDPLSCQPVWETMLQIPTYTVLADGISRGLARRAFADVLPPEIRKRQVKGTGTPFYQHVVRNNRAILREVLHDGLLARGGYLDRKKLSDYLSADEPFVTVPASQVLGYLSAEIWLQQWTAVGQRAAA